MKLVNAAGSAITEYLVRFALIGLGKKPESCVLHPAQMAMAENAGITVLDVAEVCRIEIDPSDHEKILDTLKHLPPRTLGGIPVREDLNLPDDIIEFRGEKGVLLAVIKNLSVPVNYR